MTNRSILRAATALTATGALGLGLLAGPPAGASPRTAAPSSPPTTTATYEPTWDSVNQHVASPEWFKDAKFGIYWHWGAFTTPQYGHEWYGREMYVNGSGINNHHRATYGDPQTEWGYEKFIDGGVDKAGNHVQFKPVLKSEGGKFDPDEWARLFKQAGARFGGPVAEHHDGYSMWDSEVNEWNSADRGPKLDLLKIFAEAIRKQDMKLLVAMHHSFNYNGFFRFVAPQSDPSLRKLYGQLPREEADQLWFDKQKEVIDQSQPDIIWNDFGLDSPGYCHGDPGPCAVDEQQRLNFLAYYFNQAEQWGKEVVTTYKHFDGGFDNRSAVEDYERGGPADIVRPYWLTDDAISSSSWSYTTGIGYYSSQQMIHALIDRVSKNGNMLLNVSPTLEGEIPQGQRDVLHDIGDYLGRYGESIYSTRAWDIYGEGPTKMGGGSFVAPKVGTNTDIRFTRNKKDDTLYATVLGWPGDNQVLNITTLGSDTTNLADLKKVELLGSSAKKSINLTKNVRQDPDGLKVTMPGQRPVASSAYVLKLSFKKGIPTPRPAADGASVYQDKDFRGVSALLAPGEYTTAELADLGLTRAKLSSVHVAPGTALVLYPGDNFTGTPTTYTSAVRSLPKKTAVGSIRVVKDLSKPFVVTNVTNSFALDTDSGGTGTPVKQQAPDGSPEQEWKLTEKTPGYHEIANPTTGLVIDGLGLGSGTFVQQVAATGADSQLWRLVSVGAGVYQLINKQTGLALDSGGNVPAGSSLKQWTVDSSPNLRWHLTAVTD
ncbi:alpha-L-fucosidase [Micromonospora endophytica]|uniref:alpha-L-fucosidase n=1 Tax=Micromonospora endophytica TaxID=515350 RepID=A0A2W2BPM2_9ACTN|nr:alpha-L-fucosidase [Micromonospora endophytica]PZF89351.1 alpha-L-fucosidase [Micromonospora endophytica]RIW42767.1 alpha-L-fucosidase [Micromonospora endophytica]